MKKIFAIFALILFAALNAFSQNLKPTPTPDDDVVKISTNLIQIDVTVTDKKGNVVKDLKPEDFEIYENGEKQEITNFSFVSNVKTQDEAAKTTADKVPVPVPQAELKPQQIRRTMALVVDDLSLSFESAYQVRRALKKFVDEQMQEGDLVAIIRTGAGIGALQQFTSDKRQLYAAIEKVRWNPIGRGRIGAFAPIEPTPLEKAKAAGDENVTEEDLKEEKDFLRSTNDFQEQVFATGTLGALKFIVGGMSQLPGRKSVILFSDGFQIFSKSETGLLEMSHVMDFLRELVDLANRASVVFYTLDARGLQTTALTPQDNIVDPTGEKIQQAMMERSDELFDTQQGLIFLAKQTGGTAYVNQNDLSGGVRSILDDQSYYLVGYQPDSATFDAKTRRFNKLSVKIKRPDVLIRYRSGFFSVAEENIAAKPTTKNLTPLQQISNALTSPFAVNDISVRLNTLFGNDSGGSYVRSLLHVDAQDLKFTDDADGSKKATFDVLAMSFGDNGQVVDQIGKSYTFNVKGAAYEKVLKEGFVYYFSFPVKKPGAYQFRVAIRDSQTAKVGSASQFIEVPNLKKNLLTVSSIVLENFTREQWQAISDGEQKKVSNASVDLSTNPMNDTSLRKFKRGTILRYGFEVYNSRLDGARKPNLSAKIRVFRDGALLLDGKQIPLDLDGQIDMERVKSVGAISLGGEMPAGEYILQIIVTDSNIAKETQKIATQFVQFELVE
ncbi:MAG TPA: VWA domain-containing protein [Pyrinomonadaceae bacterium]